ncbi:extracellular solute-binding protein family 1 [Clostridium sp. CAG:1013]|nr:extracellular solute-binding protein family 1 [Clostridium sp. CAG:1013]
MMRLRKLLSSLMAAAILVSAFAGCNSGTPTSSTTEETGNDSSVSTPAEEEETAEEGGGSAEGTPLELWTFQEVHRTFYETMADKWNEANPDKAVNLTVSVQPFSDMHNKLTIALQSGEGAPDMCDVEINKFPTYLEGEPQFVDLTSYVDPYRDEIVASRLEVYSKDGVNYGIPTHVGATVAFYDTSILNEAGVDYKEIKTWDDYKEAGLKVVEATGKAMGAAETNGIFIYEAMLAAQDADMTDENGAPTLDSPESIKALTTIQDLAQSGVDQTIPGGSVDGEEGYGAINAGGYATIIRPLWYMSRYPAYMEGIEAGRIGIAPMPVFDEADFGVSYGGGGTGTVVTVQSENPELAGEWLCWAKLSEEGNRDIWNVLGFDPCNTSLWEDEELTTNEDNQFISFFIDNPFDVLNTIKDDIRTIKSTYAVPTISDIMTTVTLPDIIENGVPAEEAAIAAQEQAVNELG